MKGEMKIPSRNVNRKTSPMLVGKTWRKRMAASKGRNMPIMVMIGWRMAQLRTGGVEMENATPPMVTSTLAKTSR